MRISSGGGRTSANGKRARTAERASDDYIRPGRPGRVLRDVRGLRSFCGPRGAAQWTTAKKAAPSAERPSTTARIPAGPASSTVPAASFFARAPITWWSAIHDQRQRELGVHPVRVHQVVLRVEAEPDRPADEGDHERGHGETSVDGDGDRAAGLGVGGAARDHDGDGEDGADPDDVARDVEPDEGAVHGLGVSPSGRPRHLFAHSPRERRPPCLAGGGDARDPAPIPGSLRRRPAGPSSCPLTAGQRPRSGRYPPRPRRDAGPRRRSDGELAR